MDRVELLVIDLQTNAEMEKSGTRLTTSSINEFETIECPERHLNDGSATPVAEPAAEATEAEAEVVDAAAEAVAEAASDAVISDGMIATGVNLF